ncbi:MAG: hypothetical protein ABIE94_02310, partial [archaeon]
IREQHFREFADLEKHFNISSHSGLEAVVRSFEEVAADVKAFEFMGRDEKYVEQVYERYTLPSNYTDLTVISFDRLKVIAKKNVGAARRLMVMDFAESLAVFKYLDNHAYKILSEQLKVVRKALGEKDYTLIKELSQAYIVAIRGDFITQIRKTLEQFGRLT